MSVRAGVALLGFIACAWALPALAADFTVPATPNHYVTDNAGVLSAATRASLENELRAYEKATGHQIIVWIGETTGDVPLETWTGDTAHQWRIGRRGYDDGAILFLFMQDHKIRIEVGYGLESSLTDAESYRIIQDVIRPRMRAGDVNGAVSGGVAAMLRTISPSYTAVSPPPAESGNAAPPIVGAIAITIFCLWALFMIVLAIVIVMRVIAAIQYGYLVMREGPTKAKADMKKSSFWGGGAGGFIGASSFSGGGFDSGGFSAGGGDFGGGGASGSW